MIPILEEAVLSTDLDCAYHDLLNCNALIPPPPGLVGDDDPRLSDARTPIPGSVVDASCAANAGIVQSKLALNGQIPASWLGTTSTTAAPGDQAELLVHKNVPQGYCGLDGAAKVPTAQLPAGVGFGTVTSVGLSMPSQFVVTGSPVTASGIISSTWASLTGNAWFGNAEGVAGPPKFYATPFPLGLIPDLDASKVTSGVFDPARIPIAVGLGPSHATGAVPDPGGAIIPPTQSPIIGGNPDPNAVLENDYLARDMTYKPVPTIGPTYQPTCPVPNLVISNGPPFIVTITTGLAGGSLFYSIDDFNRGFTPIASGGTVSINSGQSLYAYCARTGYTNSIIAVMPAPYAPPGEIIVTGDPLDPTEPILGDDGITPLTVGP
jgi:hypothetical protein